MGSSNGETNSNDMENYEEAESLMAQQPTKVRPPAKFFLGQPQKYKNPRKCPLPPALLPPMAAANLRRFRFFLSSETFNIWMTHDGAGGLRYFARRERRVSRCTAYGLVD